jgi:OFA family oxalate/formate antiporter-like MFS transporter
LKFPLNSPPGVSSEKNSKSNKDGQSVTSSCDYSAKEMLRSASFYLIWLVFLIGTGGGLMVISQASPFGQNIVELSPIIAGSVIMVMGFSYGGFLGTMPSITADYYGLKNVGLNYAWVYTGWGAAGYFGPQVALKYW